jgi:hypothetical protein
MATKPLSQTHPAVAAEWHPTLNGDLTPDKVSAGSHKKVWWLGECGHEFIQEIRERKRNCLICLSLEYTHPVLAAEWHPTLNGKLKPVDFKPGSAQKVWWLGKCGHEWESKIYARSNGSNCPFCSGRYAISGSSDLRSTHLELSKEWHPTKNDNLRPESVKAGSHNVVWWLGKCGHEWESVVKSRAIAGHGCPYCSSNKVLEGLNDLGTVFPEVAKEWHPTLNGGLKPNEVISGSKDKVWWLGECGHEWEAVVDSRTRGNRGCGYCSGNSVLVGFNDLASTHAELLEEWNFNKNDIEPNEVSFGSNKKYWWTCSNGHDYQARLTHRSHGSKCPKCSKGGFSSVDPGLLYFIHNREMLAFKIGITNVNIRTNRLKMFVRKGWSVLATWENSSGFVILETETRFLSWLRHEKNIPQLLDKTSLGGRLGATETFSDSILTQAEVIAKIEELLAQAE